MALLNTIDADIDVYVTIPNFAAIHASAHAPGLSEFITNYGGFF